MDASTGPVVPINRLGADAEFRFVNVAEWASPATFQAATSHPDFPGRDLPFAGHPGLYEVIRR